MQLLVQNGGLATLGQRSAARQGYKSILTNQQKINTNEKILNQDQIFVQEQSPTFNIDEGYPSTKSSRMVASQLRSGHKIESLISNKSITNQQSVLAGRDHRRRNFGSSVSQTGLAYMEVDKKIGKVLAPRYLDNS